MYHRLWLPSAVVDRFYASVALRFLVKKKIKDSQCATDWRVLSRDAGRGVKARGSQGGRIEGRPVQVEKKNSRVCYRYHKSVCLYATATAVESRRHQPRINEALDCVCICTGRSICRLYCSSGTCSWCAQESMNHHRFVYTLYSA